MPFILLKIIVKALMYLVRLLCLRRTNTQLVFSTLILTYRNVKQFISCHNFVLLFVTQLVHLGAIRAPFYPLQHRIAYSENTDFMGFSGWIKVSIPAEYFLFFIVAQTRLKKDQKRLVCKNFPLLVDFAIKAGVKLDK